jgi:CRISPR-associated protein Cas2
MGETLVPVSGYKGMWMFTMFDLPVDDAAARKRYTRFRKGLLKKGFTMLQFSVYARYFASEEAAEIIKKKVILDIPDEGQVRLLLVTDRQFGKMEVFFGKKRKPTEDPPMQMTLF